MMMMIVKKVMMEPIMVGKVLCRAGIGAGEALVWYGLSTCILFSLLPQECWVFCHRQF